MAKKTIYLVDRSLNITTIKIPASHWKQKTIVAQLGETTILVSKTKWNLACGYIAFTSKPKAEKFISDLQEKARQNRARESLLAGIEAQRVCDTGKRH